MNTVRIVLLGMVCVGIASAQESAADPLAGLSQSAQRAEADWLKLAQDLDARLARMLPCDARVATSIEDVRRLSDARAAAINAYLQAAITLAARDVESARGVVAAERDALAAVSIERTDTEQERAGLESQILNLSESVSQRAGLGAALDQLRQIQGMIQQRAGWAAQEFSSGDEILSLLGKVVSALEAREQALRQQSSAYEGERTRWNTYYQDRLTRARLECTITGGGR